MLSDIANAKSKSVPDLKVGSQHLPAIITAIVNTGRLSDPISSCEFVPVSSQRALIEHRLKNPSLV